MTHRTTTNILIYLIKSKSTEIMLIECRLDYSLSARDDHKIVPVNTSKHHARLFLEKIAVELVAVHQPDTALPVLALLGKVLQLNGRSSDLSAQVPVRLKPALTNAGVMQEISDRQA